MQGCFYHGCPRCFQMGRDKAIADAVDTFNTRYEATLAKMEALRVTGWDLIEMWECDFCKEMKKNPEIGRFLKNHPLLERSPLNPRDAFYGGRTENSKTYYKSKDGEKVSYFDVCSLYPYICKYGKFPIGHPEVLVGEECNTADLRTVDGLIKCKILPPTDLYHPVLPQKMNQKLMFVLCSQCGENLNQDECTHSDKDRALTGTWVLDEVVKALEKGYKIMEIFEIWKYKILQQSREQAGLFTAMINKFIKIKQEASGWPQNCEIEEERNRYIEEFLGREDVKLEFSAIVYNPGLRSLAKLILNSFWGKFGRAKKRFFDLTTNPQLTINSLVEVNEETILVTYVEKDECTTQARLKLYSYLEKLAGRVLYYDTDSVIFSHKEGDYVPPTGDFLGDLTNKLDGPKAYITEFVSGGPKNYAYSVFPSNKVVCKVKGIKLNYSTSQLVNFETMKKMILESTTEPIKIVSNNLRRTGQHDVVTKEEIKIYRTVSLKRKFLTMTTPYLIVIKIKSS